MYTPRLLFLSPVMYAVGRTTVLTSAILDRIENREEGVGGERRKTQCQDLNPTVSKNSVSGNAGALLHWASWLTRIPVRIEIVGGSGRVEMVRKVADWFVGLGILEVSR